MTLPIDPVRQPQPTERELFLIWVDNLYYKRRVITRTGGNIMKNTTTIAIAALTAFGLLPAIGQAKSADEAKIEELEAAFAAA